MHPLLREFKKNHKVDAMETVKFNPCVEDIEKRKGITPYGAAAEYVTEEPSTMEFVLYLPHQTLPDMPEEATTRQEAVYRPPALYEASITQPVEFTVRISNIPLNITNHKLYEILFKQCGNCFKRCNLVYDKETRVSRGIAYVGCTSKEQGLEFAKNARKIVLDSFKMCVEVLFDR